MKTNKQFKKSSGWKNNWNSWLKRPKSKSNPSTKNKNKSENFIKHTLWSKPKSSRLKPSSKKKKRKAILNNKKSTNTQLLNSKNKLKNWKLKEPKSRNKVTKKSEPFKDKGKNLKLNWKGKSLSLKKRKRKSGSTNLSTKKSSGLSIQTSRRLRMLKMKRRLRRTSSKTKSVLLTKREEKLLNWTFLMTTWLKNLRLKRNEFN